MSLEGVVGIWWLNDTFTPNWKLVEPGTVTFAKGESHCQLVPVPHGTFQGATATEIPIMRAEPEAAAELLRWREERRGIATQPENTHQPHRNAEDIVGHLTKVPVPP